MFEFSQLVTSPLHVPALLFRPPDPPPRTTVSALYAQPTALYAQLYAQPTVPLCVCVVLFTTLIYVVDQRTVTVLLYCTLVQNDARNCDAELHCEVRVKYNAVISAPTSDLPVLLPPSTLPITSNPFHPCLHSPIVSMSFEDVSDHFPIGIHFNFKSFNF